MDNEPYEDLTHHGARDLLPTIFPREVTGYKTEFPLPSGVIADVIFRTKAGRFVIIEVKTILRDSLVDAAWQKYSRFCHQLYVGVPNMAIKSLCDVPFMLEWTPDTARVGLLGIYRDCLAEIRPARERGMDPGHRQAVEALFSQA